MRTALCIQFKIYLIDLPKVDAIRNRPRVLQSRQKGTTTQAKVTVNYYTASQDASDSYVKVRYIFVVIFFLNISIVTSNLVAKVRMNTDFIKIPKEIIIVHLYL